MIINKNLSVETRSDMPNADWTGEAKYIVDDNSDLARKILSCNYGFTPIENKKGNLIDVTPTPPPPQPEPTPQIDLEEIALDHEFRLSSLEIGL